MFNLSKKTEYGLMALSYLSGLAPDQRANVTEIADFSGTPRELLAKILSELVKAGLAESISGPNGGFRLARPASMVSLGDILRALERRPGLIDCQSADSTCQMTEVCNIRVPLARVHQKVSQILEETFLTDIMPERFPA